jgi:hypothetical protein
LVVQRLALVAIILVVMGQVQSTERESIADEGELTDDEMNVASGGDNVNHEVHAQGAPHRTRCGSGIRGEVLMDVIVALVSVRYINKNRFYLSSWL